MNISGGVSLLVATVAAVGVLHTIVPDHWLPIALLARQRGWTARQTASAAATAGLGHTVSTLFLGLLVWIAGALAAQRFGHALSYASSIALVAFGLWIAIGALREQRYGHRHMHRHSDGTVHAHYHLHDELVHEHTGAVPEAAMHEHAHAMSGRTSLLLILGSSPMIEGIPAFFAAGRFGSATLGLMAVVFAVATIGTYVALCVGASRALDRVNLGPFEKYGEVLSGIVVILAGVVFALWQID